MYMCSMYVYFTNDLNAVWREYSLENMVLLPWVMWSAIAQKYGAESTLSKAVPEQNGCVLIYSVK